MTLLDAARLDPLETQPPDGDSARARTARMLHEMRRRNLLCLFSRDAAKNATLELAAQLVERVAFQNGSLGLLYAMHLSQLASLVRHTPDNPFFAGVLADVSDRQMLIASATSEIGTGGDVLRSLCEVERDGHGERRRLRKHCGNISYLELADLVLVTARAPGQSLVACRRSEVVVEEAEPHELLGLRGISNARYRLAFTFLEDAIFTEEFATISKRTMSPVVFVLWAACWSGIAARAVSIAKRHAAQLGASAAENPRWARLADLESDLLLLNSTISHCSQEFDRAGPMSNPGQGTSFARLKILASDLAPRICIHCLGLVGLRGYTHDGDLSLCECIADVLSAPAMISNDLLRTRLAALEPYFSVRL